MKRVRLPLLATLVLLLTLSFNSVSFASINDTKLQNDTVEQQGIVKPMSEFCLVCGIGYLTLTTTTFNWQYTGNFEKCTEHTSCIIKEYSRLVVKEYNCNYCSFGTTTSTTEYDYRHTLVY